ncbi:MAG: GIY-YIG nuclease family protein [Bacteroidota bacterium]
MLSSNNYNKQTHQHFQCSDSFYEASYTNYPDGRLTRHSKGKVHYTKDKLPLELITYTAFRDKYKAFAFEKYLKSGSGAAFRNKRLV